VTFVQQPAVQGAVGTIALVAVLSGQGGEWFNGAHEVYPTLAVHHIRPLAHVLSQHVATTTTAVWLEPDDSVDLRVIIPPGLPPVK